MTASQLPQETKTPLCVTIAIVLGALCGILHVTVQDSLLTALAVTFFTMIMGVVRPLKPWRWTLLVGLPVPLVLVIAKVSSVYQNFTKSTLIGSVAIILPGIAGAVGGSVMRRFLSEVFFQKKN